MSDTTPFLIHVTVILHTIMSSVAYLRTGKERNLSRKTLKTWKTVSAASEFVIKFKKSIIAAQKVNSLDVSVVEKLWNELIYVD